MSYARWATSTLEITFYTLFFSSSTPTLYENTNKEKWLESVRS
jgi:hypothetical protein